MKRLRLDELQGLLPDLDELRPLLDHALAESGADDGRAWARSGELATVGDRLVDPDALSGAAERLAAREQRHLLQLYEAIGRALVALGDDRPGAAAEALLQAAALEESRDRPSRAEAYAEAAHRVAERARDRRPAALALRRWGRAARTQGKLAEAERRYAMSHEIARAMGDVRGAAEAAIGAGNVMEDQGRWDEAERWYRAALTQTDTLPEAAPERWHALLNLHIVARSRGRLDESRRLLQEAEGAAAAAADPAARVFLENAKGQLCMAEGDHEGAEYHLREALEAAGGGRAEVTVRLNLAESLLVSGRSLDASEMARIAESVAVRAGLAPKLPEVYRLLGRIAAERSNPDAFVLFERALELVAERGLPDLEAAMTLQAYATAEAGRGEEEAAAHLRSQAVERYRRLGITDERHPWADVFGPRSEPDTELASQPEIEP